MVVRIRLHGWQSHGTQTRSGALDRQTALAVSSLMTPLALIAWALGFWRLGADMKWAGEFAIARGLFSHWQVWFALGIMIQFAAFLLQRYANRDESTSDTAFPEIS
ncbi:MAG: hypothetical protein H7Y20_05150 [Bryobacteraceae bacterium]|nr:hypothetical protein [Bryobacteraceae bacterium]